MCSSRQSVNWPVECSCGERLRLLDVYLFIKLSSPTKRSKLHLHVSKSFTLSFTSTPALVFLPCPAPPKHTHKYLPWSRDLVFVDPLK